MPTGTLSLMSSAVADPAARPNDAESAGDTSDGVTPAGAVGADGTPDPHTGPIGATTEPTRRSIDRSAAPAGSGSGAGPAPAAPRPAAHHSTHGHRHHGGGAARSNAALLAVGALCAYEVGAAALNEVLDDDVLPTLGSLVSRFSLGAVTSRAVTATGTVVMWGSVVSLAVVLEGATRQLRRRRA